MRATILILLTASFLIGCASKVEKFDDYNHSDAKWLDIINEHISKNELEKADSAYVSLYSEHIASPLLRPAALMLSKAHSSAQEYKLANYYLDEFNKLFGSASNQDWVEFLKVRNDYYALALPQRNQALLMATLNQADNFLSLYPNSKYVPIVASIKTRLQLAHYLMDKKIVELYKRMGHDESAAVITEQMQNNDLANVPYIEPELVWYRKLFE